MPFRNRRRDLIGGCSDPILRYVPRMLLTFQTLLDAAGILRTDVRLLRHAKRQGAAGLSPFQAWRDRREVFERYQSTQPVSDRRFFGVPYWAAFVATPDRGTLFVGLYRAAMTKESLPTFDCPLSFRPVAEGLTDFYQTEPVESFALYAGKMTIEWGAGTRSWAQHASRNIKPIIELRREESEAPYPGHSTFLTQLSEVEAFPSGWRAVLTAARGIYLLTCPRTKEQYVGAAFAEGGFLARWTQHAIMSGDAIAFRSRDPEDYRVSILEVAGSLATDHDIGQMEERWKEKLQSREMGLNRN